MYRSAMVTEATVSN